MALTIDQLQIEISAEAKKAETAIDALAQNLKDLQAALGPLANINLKVSNSFKAVTNNIQKTTNATTKHSSETDKASKSAKGFTDKLANQISKFRTLYGAFKSIAGVMGDLFNESNDYIETLNLFEVAMGKNTEAAKEYAETVQNAMGIDSKDWMNYQAIFQNLATGFGVSGDAATVMSQNLTQLSYDLSSIYNTDVEAAFDKLSSAMSGQVKGLREFGIDTTVATLQEYALSKGIDKSVRSMSQAEKAMLRYNYIMEQSRDLGYWNDMAKTIITPANSLRILSAQITQMKRAFGNVISVIATQVIPYVQAFVELVTEGANKLANLFGFELPDLNGDKFAQAFGDAEEDAEGVEGSLKKIKKQMMGFDELNIISNPDSDSKSGDSSSGGNLNMDLLEYDFLAGLKTEELDEYKNKLKDILWYVGEIAAGFLLWKLSKKFLGSLNALSVTLGLVLIVDSIRDVITDGLSWESVIKGAIGGALVGAGIGFKFGGPMGALLGATIGIGVSLLIQGITSMLSEGITTENVVTTIAGALGTAAAIAGTVKFFNGKTKNTTPELKTASDTIEQTSTGTSALTGKLKSFATNMAWGLLILVEVAAAAIIFVGAIAILGWELEQVGIAWQPVLDNGVTVGTALVLGTVMLLAVGEACKYLGTAGAPLAGYIGLGMLILLEMGAAAILFLAEIWAIGKMLDQIRIAWEPVLANAGTVEYAIETGTGLLIAIGVVTAALGAATVATAGALPLAIGIGTLLLVELAEAFIVFVAELIKVADQLSYELHPALQRLNEKLPDLTDDMEDFTEYMKFFAGQVVSYTKSSAISGFSATVDSIIKFFTKDPIKSLADDANKQYNQAKNLNEKLRLANPELNTATSLMKKYYTFLEELEKLTQKTNGITLASGMYVNMKEVGKNLVLGLIDGIKSQSNSLSSTLNSIFGKGIKLNVSFDTWVSSDKKKVYEALGLSGWPSLKWYTYANGGLPQMGEMFIAREAGPELVGSIGRKTAVANNDQIVSGIEAGVYRAMVAANSNGNSGSTQTIRIINEIDGDIVGEKVIKYHNNKVMQTGASPLLV